MLRMPGGQNRKKARMFFIWSCIFLYLCILYLDALLVLSCVSLDIFTLFVRTWFISRFMTTLFSASLQWVHVPRVNKERKLREEPAEKKYIDTSENNSVRKVCHWSRAKVHQVYLYVNCNLPTLVNIPVTVIPLIKTMDTNVINSFVALLTSKLIHQSCT